MIRLEELNKTYHAGGVARIVARNISVTFPTGSSVALMGRNGAGKSSLLKMIAGTMDPDSGHVVSDGLVSWPVGFGGSFHGDLTGAQNTRFVARIYGVDTDELSDFVATFTELGDYFHLPFRTYSSGMRARLAFGVSMGIGFDTYLVDEVTSVGDASFRKKSESILHERLETGSAIVVSHSMDMLRRICNCGAVLENGSMAFYDDLEEAISHHNNNMGV